MTGRRLLLASGNPGKLEEVRWLLEPVGVAVVSPREVGWPAEVEEDGLTLEANAAKKARAGFQATGLATLADDTGLFVDALAGVPGVHSARYAGPEADPAANCAKLLRELSGVSGDQRGAEFRCVLALVPGAIPWEGGGPGPESVTEPIRLVSGVCRGRIRNDLRGEAGFGYDPLFQPEGSRLTFAEMPAAKKNAISHRGRALAALLQFLKLERTRDERV